MMERKIWFKAKRFGWGWYPCSWQGWAVLALYFYAVISNILFINHHLDLVIDSTKQFVPQIYVLTIFLIIICYITGEKPTWNWSLRKKNELKNTETHVDKKSE